MLQPGGHPPPVEAAVCAGVLSEAASMPGWHRGLRLETANCCISRRAEVFVSPCRRKYAATSAYLLPSSPAQFVASANNSVWLFRCERALKAATEWSQTRRAIPEELD
jgi:hypothetical protein